MTFLHSHILPWHCQISSLKLQNASNGTILWNPSVVDSTPKCLIQWVQGRPRNGQFPHALLLPEALPEKIIALHRHPHSFERPFCVRASRHLCPHNQSPRDPSSSSPTWNFECPLFTKNRYSLRPVAGSTSMVDLRWTPSEASGSFLGTAELAKQLYFFRNE